MRLPARALPAIPLTLLFTAANAQWRCDCTTILDSCTAEVSVEPAWVEVTSDRAACSRVDYFIDGLPFVSVVVDGSAREDWVAPSGDARVVVQSCQVCRDLVESGSAEPAASTGGEAPDGGALEPVVVVEPEYPGDAQRRGIEGFVDVEFTVTPFGDVEDARVSGAEPAGVFEMAALSAVSRWRYPVGESRPAERRTERVTFSLEDFIWSDPSAPRQAAGVRSANQCVRQNVEYNFGEVIEIGLMNACADALIVFACGEGTGAHAGRWVCTDSETQRRTLVRPGDPRIGSRAQFQVLSGSRLFDYTDEFYVTRAPNSEYWWVACRATDNACRDQGRQWRNSVDRQTAIMNPRRSTNLTVSRSY